MFNFSFNYSQSNSSNTNNINSQQNNNLNSFLYNMINESQNMFGNITENISNGFSDVLNESFNQEQQRENSNPTRKNIIEKLKTVKLNEIEEKDCSICLEEYNYQSKIILLPCLHCFHSKCIKKWLSKNVTCPICRKDINKENPVYPKTDCKRKISKKINITDLEFFEIPLEPRKGIRLKIRYKHIFLERKFAPNTQIQIIQAWIANKIKKKYTQIKLMLNYPKKILNPGMTLEEEEIIEDSLIYVY